QLERRGGSRLEGELDFARTVRCHVRSRFSRDAGNSRRARRGGAPQCRECLGRVRGVSRARAQARPDCRWLRLVSRSKAGAGTPARWMDGTDAIVTVLAKDARPGDVILGMSNGGFGGFHAKLLKALAAR